MNSTHRQTLTSPRPSPLPRERRGRSIRRIFENSMAGLAVTIHWKDTHEY